MSIECCLESSSSRNPLRKGEEKRMANHKIFVPFPIWDLLEKQEEIAEMLKNELGVHPPRGTPRGIKFKSVPRGKDECDRLKVTLWYPPVGVRHCHHRWLDIHMGDGMVSGGLSGPLDRNSSRWAGLLLLN